MPSFSDKRWAVHRIALVYAVFSVLWIYFSDRTLLALVRNLDALTRVQMYKGWVFVALSTLLLYGLLAREDWRRRRAEASVRESEDALRAFSRRLQQVREEERAGIAREIHDQFGQALTQLMMDVSWLGRRELSEPEPVRARLDQMTACIEQAIGVARRISSSLRPGVLDDLGLAAAVEWQAQEFQDRSGISCHVEDRTRDVAPPGQAAIALFRIFQELLTNVSRHADATRVDVVLSVQGDQWVMEVVDDGRGITAAQAGNPRAIGLLGMRERAVAVGGRFQIGPGVAGGTRAVVSTPMAAPPDGRDVE